MVVKVYISRTTGNKEMKKKQDHILSILESKQIDHQQVDIGDPLQEKERQFMRENTSNNNNGITNNNNNNNNNNSKCKNALPPQIFNDQDYIGDYTTFFQAVECEQLYEYLKIDIPKDEVEYIVKHAAEVEISAKKKAEEVKSEKKAKKKKKKKKKKRRKPKSKKARRKSQVAKSRTMRKKKKKRRTKRREKKRKTKAPKRRRNPKERRKKSSKRRKKRKSPKKRKRRERKM